MASVKPAPRGPGLPKPSGLPPEGEPTRLIGWNDVRVMGSLPPGLLVAWGAPEPWWDALGKGFSRLHSTRSRRLAQHIRTVIGPASLADSPEQVALEYLANRLPSKLQRLRLLGPRGWNPELRLQGREHIAAALAQGRGAVLWIAPFLFSGLVSKLTLHRAGFAISHLSRHDHGFSRTAFGIRILNPLITRVENRYAERIVIPEDGSVRGAFQAMQQRLRENGLVSVTVGPQGVQALSAPVLSGALRVAPGAPKLAARARAPLLPVVVIREAPGSFITFVEPPLELPGGLPPGTVALQAVAELGRRLEPYLLRWPGQFNWAELGVR